MKKETEKALNECVATLGKLLDDENAQVVREGTILLKTFDAMLMVSNEWSRVYAGVLERARVEEEQRLSSEYREQYGIAERRANALHGELEESRTLLEQSDRGRRQAEAELAEANEHLNDLSAQNNSLGLAKRKLESELQTLHVSKIVENIIYIIS